MKEMTISVAAEATYLPDQSVKENNRFLWSYEIIVANNSEEIVQLLNRYWRITDMSGQIEEVRGPGVVGLQPLINPGEKFTYTSFCQLNTPQGTMEGHYEMQTLKKLRFNVEIPKFILSTPDAISSAFRAMLH